MCVVHCVRPVACRAHVADVVTDCLGDAAQASFERYDVMCGNCDGASAEIDMWLTPHRAGKPSLRAIGYIWSYSACRIHHEIDMWVTPRRAVKPSMRAIGYIWSYLACRIGRLGPHLGAMHSILHSGDEGLATGWQGGPSGQCSGS
jgi:hypothetical protein